MKDKEGAVKAAIFSGIFVVLAACVTGIFLLINTLLEQGIVVVGPGVQIGNPQSESASANPTTSLQGNDQLSVTPVGLECRTHSSGYCGLNMQVRWENLTPSNDAIIYVVGYAPYYNPPLWWIAGSGITPSASNGQYLNSDGAYGNPGDSLEVFVCLTTASYQPGDEFYSRPQCIISSSSIPFSPR